MDRHVKWRSHCDPAALDRRIKLRCRYECKATDPCLWFSSHRVGHLFAAQQKNRVSGGHAQILLNSHHLLPGTGAQLCFLITQLHISFDLFHPVLWNAVVGTGSGVGFWLTWHDSPVPTWVFTWGLRSIVNSSKTHTLVRRPLNCPSVPEWEGNRLVTRM